MTSIREQPHVGSNAATAAGRGGPYPWQGGSVEGWTVPALLLERAKVEPDVVALREKWLGRYHEYSWSELVRQAGDFALGLVDLGLESGERVAIMGDLCREYVFAELGVSLAGGVAVGIYPTSAPTEVAYQLRDSGASIFVAEDQEHLDKVLAVADEVPALRAIVVMDTRAVFLYEASLTRSFEDVQLRGAELAREDPGRLVSITDRIRPDDPLCLIYTSGTTGSAKGVLHTHSTALHGAESFVLTSDLREREQQLVAHLPAAHIVGKALTTTLPLVTRVVPHIPEHVELFTESIYEVAPTFVMQPPRFFEKFAAQMLVSIDSSSWLKRKTYAVAMRVARATLRRRWQRRRVPLYLRLPYGVARLLVFVPLLRQIGYHRLLYAYTGSAAVPPEVAALWQAWGVDLRIIYGLTESGCLITAQLHPFPNPTDIGERVPLPDWKIEIASDGELLFRAPSNFVEYWGKPEATAETLVDGWLHTGDVVEVDEHGLIKLVDRKKDIIITSGGKSLSPQQIENELKASPYVSEAIVFGDRRKFVTALLELDDMTVSEWARGRKIAYGSYTDLVGHPDVQELIAGDVEKANFRLSRVEQVKRFRILPHELDPEAGEVTPTRKIKRKLMEEMFQDLVAAMYEERSSSIDAQMGSAFEERGQSQ